MAPTRRQFLASTAALPLTAGIAPARPATPTADAVIVILMTGGPSQLDTFDSKPDAPADIRGPFRTIPTRTPGVRVSELFPKLAAMSHRWSLIRSMTSDAPPIHEVGVRHLAVGGDRPSCQLGADPDFGGGMATRSGGAVVATGASFEARCRAAARMALGGTRRLTIPMFPTVFDAPSWDCHADGGSLGCDLGDYRDTVGPLFDLAVSKLLTDLHDRGLLDRTLVVATGEFGRTPKPNCNGGRDHWPACWTTLIAGGGVKGGRVIGRSDATASAPVDRPVSPAELVATIFLAVGIPAHATMPGPADEPVAVYNAEPVRELFS